MKHQIIEPRANRRGRILTVLSSDRGFEAHPPYPTVKGVRGICGQSSRRVEAPSAQLADVSSTAFLLKPLRGILTPSRRAPRSYPRALPLCRIAPTLPTMLKAKQSLPAMVIPKRLTRGAWPINGKTPDTVRHRGSSERSTTKGPGDKSGLRKTNIITFGRGYQSLNPFYGENTEVIESNFYRNVN